jgi:hypothetical protein
VIHARSSRERGRDQRVDGGINVVMGEALARSYDIVRSCWASSPRIGSPASLLSDAAVRIETPQVPVSHRGTPKSEDHSSHVTGTEALQRQSLTGSKVGLCYFQTVTRGVLWFGATRVTMAAMS